MEFPIIKSLIILGVFGTLGKFPIFYSSNLSLLLSSFLFWQMKDLEVLFSSTKLTILILLNFTIQNILILAANLISKASFSYKYEILVFSLFLKYHKKVSPIWIESNFLMATSLALLCSFSKLSLPIVSEKISDLILPTVSDFFHKKRAKEYKFGHELEKLIELGFDKDRAQEALDLNGGNLENAATFLLSS